MATVSIPLPLLRRDLLGFVFATASGPVDFSRPYDHTDWDTELFFTVDEGRLIISTIPFADDPVINPQTGGAYTQ